MYRKLLIGFIIIIFYNSYSQNLRGKLYDKRGHYLIINKKYCEFLLPFPNSIDTSQFEKGIAGHGNILIKKNKIIIKPKIGYLRGSESSYQLYPDSTQSGIFKFRIYDNLDNLLPKSSTLNYTQLNSLRKEGVTIWYWTSSRGETEFKVIAPKDSIIYIGNWDHQELRIKMTNLNGGTYVVKLFPGSLLYNNFGKTILKYTLKNDTIYYRYVKFRNSKSTIKLPTYYLIKQH
jgi:hypothetical protein